MSDLPRLRSNGSPDERALLNAAVLAPLSEQTRRELRWTLEERLSPRGRRRAAAQLTLALTGTLIAGSALAYGVLRFQAHRHLAPPRPIPAASSGRSIAGPAPGEAAPSAPPAEALPSVRPAPPPARRHASVSPPPRAPAATNHPFGLPGLRDPQDLLAPPPPSDSDAVAVPLRPPPRLLIKRPGRREIALVMAGDQIVGKVRDSVVALTVTPAQIVGKLGEHNVWLWLQGRQAKGTIADVPMRFELLDDGGAQTLRAGNFPPGPLPARSARITATANTLAWSPGCNVALTAARPGIYQGQCERGSRAQVVVPRSWQQLPALTRMILLSFFLTERDAELNDLFGRPDWAEAASVE